MARRKREPVIPVGDEPPVPPEMLYEEKTWGFMFRYVFADIIKSIFYARSRLLGNLKPLADGKYMPVLSTGAAANFLSSITSMFIVLPIDMEKRRLSNCTKLKEKANKAIWADAISADDIKEIDTLLGECMEELRSKAPELFYAYYSAVPYRDMG